MASKPTKKELEAAIRDLVDSEPYTSQAEVMADLARRQADQGGGR
jgi:arginine repressor